MELCYSRILFPPRWLFGNIDKMELAYILECILMSVDSVEIH